MDGTHTSDQTVPDKQKGNTYFINENEILHFRESMMFT